MPLRRPRCPRQRTTARGSSNFPRSLLTRADANAAAGFSPCVLEALRSAGADPRNHESRVRAEDNTDSTAIRLRANCDGPAYWIVASLAKRIVAGPAKHLARHFATTSSVRVESLATPIASVA